MTRRLIPWEPSPHGGPLGRHINHDPRSKNFRVARQEAPLRSVAHKRRVPVYDQGNTGSCVAHAGKGVLSTSPFRRRFTSEPGIIATYSELTRTDDVPGQYPPDDTGSDGLSFAKLAVKHRWCSYYQHCFGITDVLHAIQATAIMVGTDWLAGMDQPDPDGRVHPTGSIRGGHEYECAEYEQRGSTRNDAEDRLWFWQSWGDWALAGRFYITVNDFAGLLDRQGDATVLREHDRPHQRRGGQAMTIRDPVEQVVVNLTDTRLTMLEVRRHLADALRTRDPDTLARAVVQAIADLDATISDPIAPRTPRQRRR